MLCQFREWNISFHLFVPTVDNALVQAGDWGRAEGSRGREVGGAEVGLRAGLQHSLAHTVATQLAQVTGTARRQVKVDREKVSSAARSLRTLIKSNWRNSAKSKETSTKSKVRSVDLIPWSYCYISEQSESWRRLRGSGSRRSGLDH